MRILSNLIVSGVLDIDTINNAAADTDKFLVADANGVIKYRTGTEVLSDIGAASAAGFVPYTGATANVDLGVYTILAQNATIASSGSGDTATITHSSGSGIALNITKGGNGEGLYINKTSGSGNAATIIGTLNATTLVKSGGTSTQYLMADGSVSTLTNPITGTGTTNYLPKFTGASTLGNSLVYDNGTNVGIGTASPTLGNLVISPTTGNGNVDGLAIIYHPDGSSIRLRAKLWINDFNGQLDLKNSADTQTVKITSNGASYLNGGNLLIGSTTDSGEKLQVTGTMKVTGASTFGGDLTVQTSANAILNINASTSSNYYAMLRLKPNGTQNAYIRFNNSLIVDNQDGTPLMTLTNAGNLGLGVTPSAWESTFRGLQVGLGTSLYNNAVGNGTFLSSNSFFNGTNNIYINTTTASAYGQSGGQHQWFTAASGTAGNAITFTQAMTLDASGNLGIGTTSTSNVFLNIANSNAKDEIMFRGTEYTNIFSETTNGFQFGISSTGNTAAIEFFTNGSEKMRLTSAGNLLLGTTSNSGELLQVNGTAKITGATTIGANITVTGVVASEAGGNPWFALNSTFNTPNNRNWDIVSNVDDWGRFDIRVSPSYGTSPTTSVLNFTSTGAATFSSSVTAASGIITGNLTVDTNTLFVDAANNRVGIGTASPANTLFVTSSTSGDYAGFIENTNSTNGYGLCARTAHTGTSAYAFTARAGSTDIFVVRGDGNVGIGTASPEELLTLSANVPVLRLASTNVSGKSYQFFSNSDGNFYLRNATTSTNLMVVTNSNNVLIGTTTDNGTDRLQVSGSANITGNLTVDTNTLFVDAANNRVGIGTASPFSLLHVGTRPGAGTTNPSLGSIATVSNDGLTGIDLGGNVNANNVVGHINWVNYLGVGNYNTARIDVYANGASNSGDLRFWTATTASSPTVRLTIASTGDATFSSSVTAASLVVSGTSTSSYIGQVTQTNTTAGVSFGLLVKGGTNSSDVALNVQSAASANLFRVFGDGQAIFLSNLILNGTSIEQNNASGLTLNASNASGAILFRTAGSERMSIASTGALTVVGAATIATTSTTGYSLVVQNSGANDATGIRLTSGGTDNGYFITAYNAVSKYASLQAGDNDAYRSIILNNLGGNVGIGTTNPTEGKLVISNSGPSIIYLKETSASVNSFWNSSDGGEVQFGVASNHALKFFTNNTERFTIASTGAATFSSSVTAASGIITGNLTVDTNTLFVDAANNRVGIGTTTPAHKLTIESDQDNLKLQSSTDPTNYYAEISANYNYANAFTIKANGAGGVQNLMIWGDGVGLTLQGGSSRPLLLQPSNGNVIIGSTTDTTQKLQVTGTVKITGASTFDSTVTGGSFIPSSSTIPTNGMYLPTTNTVGFATNSVQRMAVKANGQVRFLPISTDPAGAEAGDVYYNSTANVLRYNNGTTWNDMAVSSSTYTPTLTAVTNVSSSTASVLNYFRNGSMVHIIGKVTFTATAAGTTRLGISLPIASNFTTNADAVGFGDSGLTIISDITNDRLELEVTATSTLSTEYGFMVTYVIK